ncbi:radical SAM protein [Paenibacillus sp. J5C_2022]|uniref:radical SAM protein n=1 Tax=Paenibacillus sp. J5C2022 TaxID=2977129 RepID=UPI0021D30227|nr:radical SAM/SPASM domain-containing protein [Paenibacillus sp. J5C2022]MCU6708715.1 radical SAM protein [Paenibacillus sp. J5C2022]
MVDGHKSFDQSAEIALLLHMPIYYSGLVVETTNRCNAKCAMCYQSASPKGSETLGLSSLDTDVIRRCIREAADIETIGSRFHLAGGEAFMYLDDVYSLFAEARDAGYEQITGTTNGFWGRTLPKAREVCARLRQSGVTSLELSWDYWHQPFVSGDAVSNCLIACQEVEIETNLRLLTTKLHSMEEALAALRPEAIDAASRMTSGPVFATGRAAKELDAEEFYHSRSSLDDNCHRVLNLTINAFGNVFPCCAGFDQTRNYIMGNVKEERLDTIVERMNNDPLVRKIVFSGIRSLVPILQESGHDIDDQYFNICHLCYTIFSTPEYVESLQEYMDNRKRESLTRIVAQLEQAAGSQEGQRI